MKKTFLTCMAVVALFAIATGASAITCTIDQRPAATLLIPYFQATFNPDGTVLGTGPSSLDTLVTIGNASAAPMLAHVNVFNDRSELVLDFNVALTGFDIQSWSMSSLLRGFLPVTPVNASHVPEVKDNPADTTPGTQVTIAGDVCQRNPLAPVYPAAGGYLRVRPTNPATGLDNTLATVSYPPGPFPTGFLFQVLDSLDVTADSNLCTGTVDQKITNPIHGYITIDHANYCNLSNPSDPKYYTNDAIGMENNLWGDYIFTSGAGVGTMGFPAVAIEANGGFVNEVFTNGSLGDNTAAPTDVTSTTPGRRTFYRRYVTVADTANNTTNGGIGCFNTFPAPQASFDCGFGDQREPLGLKYAARWFDSTAVTSSFNVWRASAVPSIADPLGLGDLLDQQAFPNGCDTSEPTVTLNFYDEDENTVTQGVCPSPCKAPKFNFPLETQRTAVTAFTHPVWPAGWVSMEFFNSTGPVGGVLDQAYVTYDFQGPSAFLSAGIPAAQLDPTNCQPLLVPCTGGGGPPNCYGLNPSVSGVTPTAPAIPLVVGTGPD
jgi:hypothetical protein